MSPNPSPDFSFFHTFPCGYFPNLCPTCFSLPYLVLAYIKCYLVTRMNKQSKILVSISLGCDGTATEATLYFPERFWIILTFWCLLMAIV